MDQGAIACVPDAARPHPLMLGAHDEHAFAIREHGDPHAWRLPSAPSTKLMVRIAGETKSG